MKGVILLLLVAGGLFYCYKYTDVLDPYLVKLGIESEASAEEISTASDKPLVLAAPDGINYVELKSADGRSMQASVISRGPVGIRAKNQAGEVYEIPFEKMDTQTVEMLKGVTKFPFP